MKTHLLVALLALGAGSQEGQPTSSPTPRGEVREIAQAHPKVVLTGRVTDAANILSDAHKASLSQQLESLERATRHQMVVVTVPTLGGKDVAAFTRELGNAWRIGRADEDDGVILLVAPNERQARIAVGYGLESKLPDALCQQIMDQEIIPRFQEGDLPGGIDAGMRALITRLQQ